MREYNQAIYNYCNYCPNIRYTSIFLDNQNMNDLENFLINCQHLEAIDAININNENCDEFLDLLIKFAPFSLYKLHISSDIFNINSLNSFFNNWKGRKTLHLYDHSTSWLEFIKEYKMEGIEGIVGYNYCHGFWNVKNYTEFKWDYP